MIAFAANGSNFQLPAPGNEMALYEKWRKGKVQFSSFAFCEETNNPSWGGFLEEWNLIAICDLDNVQEFANKAVQSDKAAAAHEQAGNRGI